MHCRWQLAVGGIVAATLLAPARTLVGAQATAVNSAIFREMAWRNIGPFEGGRTDAAVGLPDAPNTFYIGVDDGGIWTTDDAGRTWRPIFDREPLGTIGALAVAPSNHALMYAGTTHGLYQSRDAGATWVRVGLDDGGAIGGIAIDPAAPDRVLVAVMGHPHGPNDARGLYRSEDGGRSFARVWFRDEDTGALDVVIDPARPATVYATLWEARSRPSDENVLTGANTSVLKSVDGGTTWRVIGQGLPTAEADGVTRIDVAIAPSRPDRLFALVQTLGHAGLYRTDDGGETWSIASSAIAGAVNLAVDPVDADTVFLLGAALARSTDAGRTFVTTRGAPGGGGYRQLWINPRAPASMILAGDRGAIVSVNGGASWSARDNQPTGEFATVTADATFPYRVCGGAPDGGSGCLTSRGPDGRIGAREWQPMAAKAAVVTPDPSDPDVVYLGAVRRYDRRTGETTDVTPPGHEGYRPLPTAPLLFLPGDSHTLLFAANSLWKTTTAGQAWTEISPDLARPSGDIAPVPEHFTRDVAERRGAIDAVAPSTVLEPVIWAGTDDGQVTVTADRGVTWTTVTPEGVTPWAQVASIEASHFDVNSAYVAINRAWLDDPAPHLFRTRDGGRTWAEIVHGLPPTGPILVIREDPFRRGLLLVGTENSIDVSFDDGETWQPLGLNLPATAVEAIAIKDTDIVIGTRGRGLWVLDDIAALRQATGDIMRAEVFLFRPSVTWRVRAAPPETPAPRDEPSAPNPPDGAVFYYALGSNAPGPVSLDIVEGLTGDILRHFSSDDSLASAVHDAGVAPVLAQPPDRLSAAAGLHRFVWDLRDAPPVPDDARDPLIAPPGSGRAAGRGVPVVPSVYQVRLTVGDRVLRQAVTIRMDPRARAQDADLQALWTLSTSVRAALASVAAARTDVERRLTGTTTADRPRLESAADALAVSDAALSLILETLEETDIRPAPALQAAATGAIARATEAIADAK